MFLATLLFLPTLTTAAPVEGGVMPLSLPARSTPGVAPVQDRLHRAAGRLARELLRQVHPWDADPALKLLTRSQSGEHWIRPNTGAVAGFAFLYRFGTYDEGEVGTSREALLDETIVPMLRYLATTHVTGTRPTSDGKPWGDAWQSAHWTAHLAHAAWWVWDDLPDDLRGPLRRVVAHEADRIAATRPPHQVELDTKAEENAWNSQVLSTAVLLLPDDPRRPGWEKAFQVWALSSFLRPADATNTTTVDGRPVSEQFTGANIRDDFTLENHSIVHPDYMTCFSLSLGSALDYAMTGRKAPEALLHNVAGLYENEKWFLMPDGGFVYPSGQDWELFRIPGWVNMHVLAATFARDPEAWPLAQTALGTLEAMQARSKGGAVYLADEWFFPSTHTDLIYALGRSWLELQAAPPAEGKLRERLGVRRLDAGKIIVNRTPNAVHTLSWGPTVMAQCAAFRLDRIVSPDPRSGIGQVRLRGQKELSKVVLRSAEVTSQHDRFDARLEVEHADARVLARLRFRSGPDGRWTMSEELVALDDVTTADVATGLIGILNDEHWIHERGERRLALGNRVETVRSRSGGTSTGEATELTVDGVLRVRSDRPLAVRYVAATKSERGRVTDRLYLNAIAGEHSWRKGEVLSRYEAVVDCIAPKDAAEARR